MKRWIYALVCILSLLAAALQYNDPDPIRWIAMYGYVALLYALALTGRYRSEAIWVGLAMVVIWAATLLPGFVEWLHEGMPSITGQMKAELPHVEIVREFLGLLLCGVALWGLAQGGPIGGS